MVRVATYKRGATFKASVMDKVLRTVSYKELGRMGRLGNSLFEISCTWAYGLKHNRIVQLPEWEYFKYFKFPFQTNNDIKVDKTYVEPAFHFNEIPDFDEDHVDLNGYFQSYKYSNDIDLNVLFELKDEYKKQVDDLYKKINPLGLRTVSVHVRRGDYLNAGTNEYHGICELSYYVASLITLLGGNLSGATAKVLFFSDDIKWCREHFKDYTGTNKYNFVEGNEDIIDLFLMAKCNDNIIANSSFSYWAALLNKNPKKKVVAPANWFGETGKHNNTKDLYKPEWIKI